MIYLTEAAAREIRRIQLSRQQPDSYFRLSVKLGGCSGLLYHLALEEGSQVGDRVYNRNGITVLVDEESSLYLTGVKVDFSEDLMGGGFRFHNPKAAATCSCGQSFTTTTCSTTG